MYEIIKATAIIIISKNDRHVLLKRAPLYLVSTFINQFLHPNCLLERFMLYLCPNAPYTPNAARGPMLRL